MSDINAMIKWFEDRRGRVGYSMSYLRYGPNYYDCSSAVFSALIAGGFRQPNSVLGTTETLYSLEGSLLIPISFSEARRGDIFVAGTKGGSSGGAGHTGVHYGNNQIIHCTYSRNGIAVTPISGYTGSPVHWYRLAGTQSQTPTPTPDEPEETEIMLPEEYIDDEYLIGIYGLRTDTVTFNDVESEADLRQQAKDYLREQLDQTSEVTLTALDLSLIDKNFDEFTLGNTYPIKAPNIMTQGERRIIRKETNWSEPQRSNLTFGTKYQAISDYLYSEKKKISSARSLRR